MMWSSWDQILISQSEMFKIKIRECTSGADDFFWTIHQTGDFFVSLVFSIPKSRSIAKIFCRYSLWVRAYELKLIGTVEEISDRLLKIVCECFGILGDEAAQIVALEILPRAFNWIEIRAVRGQERRADAMPIQ